MQKFAPLITGLLVGITFYICDALFMIIGNSTLSPAEVFFTAVPMARMTLRILVILIGVLVGGIKVYMTCENEKRNLGLQEGNKDFWNDNRDMPVAKTSRKARKTTSLSFAQRKNSQKSSKNSLHKSFADECYSEQLWVYAGKLGEAIHLDYKRLNNIRMACYCYNLGHFCIGSQDEKSAECDVNSHAEFGAKIAEAVPELQGCADIIRYHHEKFDGSGLMGLAGDEISVENRIFSIAWVYNSLVRPDGGYRLDQETALETLYHYGGTALDPELVAVFINIMSNKKLYVEVDSKEPVFAGAR